MQKLRHGHSGFRWFEDDQDLAVGLNGQSVDYY